MIYPQAPTDNDSTIQSFHPSDVVNRYLLSKVCMLRLFMNKRSLTTMPVIQEPSAGVAITHDSQWSTLFEKARCQLYLIDSTSDSDILGSIEARGPWP